MERSEERGRRTFIDVRKIMTDKDDIYRIFCFIPTDNSKKIFLHWSEVNSSVLKTESYFFDPFDLKGKSTGTFNFARGSRMTKNIR